jgi:branched-chain amino acid transport system ATP-binding protein
MTTLDPILSVTGVQKHFEGIHVLKDVSLTLPRGRITALIGSNGAGKSTLLNVISGFIAADAGTIVLDGRRIDRISAYRRARLGISRSFQHPRVFGSLSVLDSVTVAATPVDAERLYRNIGRLAWLPGAASARSRERARDALQRCHMGHKLNTAVRDLGYGEQKLLMLAQLLAKGGCLLCLDELCAGLEPTMITQVIATLRNVLAGGASILFIEHNLELVRTIADDVLFMHQGEIMRSGPALEVLQDRDVNRLYLGQ